MPRASAVVCGPFQVAHAPSGQTTSMVSAVRTGAERADDEIVVALPDDATAPGQARAAVRDILLRWNLADLLDDAELAVSELVTNAVRHGLPPVSLRVCQRPDSIRIDVSDMRPATASIGLPVSRDDDESGRGRSIVDAVSDQSGTDEVFEHGPGKSSYASWDVATLASDVGGPSPELSPEGSPVAS
jgi:anti-sigma regulatory factor (Ser/Thr protein kinase)